MPCVVTLSSSYEKGRPMSDKLWFVVGFPRCLFGQPRQTKVCRTSVPANRPWVMTIQNPQQVLAGRQRLLGVVATVINGIIWDCLNEGLDLGAGQCSPPNLDSSILLDGEKSCLVVFCFQFISALPSRPGITAET